MNKISCLDASGKETTPLPPSYTEIKYVASYAHNQLATSGWHLKLCLHIAKLH